MANSLTQYFRSYEQMDLIYQKLHKKGLVDEPYVIKKHKGNQYLIFIGARHSNDINDSQNQVIEKEWSRFIVNKNDAKIALCEGGLRPKSTSREKAIVKYSEPGLLTWLAIKDKVPIVSPEPDETKEINYLKQEGYDVAEIMTYYFGRQMYQWIKRDYLTNPDWKKYAKRHINSYAQQVSFTGEQLTLETVYLMFRKVTEKDFSIEDEALLYELSDPTSNPVSAASGVFRDMSLFAAITNAWKDGKDIFSLYGSGHAIILEKALKSL